MRVTSLASGSSGNAYLVQTSNTALLVDAGVTLNRLLPALQSAGLTPAALDGILLTHEHSDHLASAGSLARRFNLPLLSTAGTLSAVRGRTGELSSVTPGLAVQIADLTVTPFSVPHDGIDPVGFLLECDDVRVVLATDLGHVPDEVAGVLRSADLLVLEANHDAERLRYGPYPRFLKERVASAKGHLSNDQTAECLTRCANGRPQWVWLAHLSDTNNSPKRALETVKRKLAEVEIKTMQVQVALRDKPSLSWSARQTYFQAALL